MHKPLLFLIPAVLFLSITQSAFAAIPNLSGRWNLNDSNSGVAKDTSGNLFNGSVVGTTLVAGKYGNAYNFSSYNDLVRIANNPSFETANISVEAWVKSSGSPGTYRYIVSKGASADLAASYGLYTGSTGGLIFYISDGTSFPSSTSPDAGTGIWDGTWHHVTGTYDGTTVRLFIDGAEIGSGKAATAALGYNLSDSNDLLIGGYAINPGTHNFVGTIDEVRVWDRALTPTEIKQHAATNSVAQINNTLYDLP